ncbi:MAG TPA: hypothetical protein VNC61_05390 [Acidimicrobiales bacterium]|nr:hypothetical protein [Acidimicrobiales bacterium]
MLSRARPWRSLAAISLVGATGVLALPSGPVQAVAVAHAVSPGQPVWIQSSLNDNGSPIALSSPNVASLAGGPAVVVGDRAGRVYAFNLATGSPVPGWPVSTGGVPVDSTPSVAAINANGLDSVFIGVGNAATPGSGGYEGISPSGATQWFTNVQNPSTDAVPAHAVQASLAVGNLQGGTDVVAGSLGEAEHAMNASNGATLPGFPWFQADSDFTTPALADLYSNGRTEIVEGGDSTAGVAYGQPYQNGGSLRVVSATGNFFTGKPAGGLVCQYNIDETAESSPAVGQFLAGGGVGIAFGTGNTYKKSTTDDLIAVNSHCGAAWTDKLDGVTTSSPALADVMGNGQLQVIEGTSAGSVYALNGSNGATLWHTSVGGQVLGSVVTADLTGGGYQDVIVPTTAGAVILDGKTGANVGSFPEPGGAVYGFQNSPLVTNDANGSIGITLAGYGVSNQGIVEHYEIAGSHSSVNQAGAWPQFHHDAQLTGDAGTPGPVVQVPCNAPSGTPTGYDMVASDGGVFNYGNLPFCGSTGNLALSQPVVGMALTHDAGGYWLVASDGGIFAFDDAGYYGSMGGKPLDKPVVGMAATPDGKGYWLVASDGGIFAFGDAGYYGSTGGYPLNKPVVGMASTPDGKGYWLVASDGGIFTFGDAVFHGSTGAVHLNKPVVGMTPDQATGGYWLVASDGGVFSFDAPFFGSTGNIALARPVVGMQALANGRGYRFVASDGGIFDYGAPFYGSTGGIVLTKPVVGMTGF